MHVSIPYNVMLTSAFLCPQMFMHDVPTCLNSWGTLTTLHIYMTDSVLADTC